MFLFFPYRSSPVEGPQPTKTEGTLPQTLIKLKKYSHVFIERFVFFSFSSTSDSVKHVVRQGGPFQREEMLRRTKFLTGVWRRVEPAWPLFVNSG